MLELADRLGVGVVGLNLGSRPINGDEMV